MKNSWKHIYSFKKLAKSLISTDKDYKQKIELFSKIDDILKSYPKGAYHHLLKKKLNMNSDVESIHNLYMFLSCEVFPQGYRLASPKDINNFHKDFLHLRSNQITGDIEINGYLPNWSDTFNSDDILTSLEAQFKSFRSRGEKGLVKTIDYPMDSYFKSGVVEKFNPILEYFESLNKSDKQDEINKVIQLFDECSLNKSGINFIDWCLGVVKNALGVSYYDRILYLYSEKGGDGKTYFIMNDLIKPLSDYISSDFSFNIDSKDDKFKMTENLILLDDEGSSTSRRSDDAKKSISSKKSVKERQAYGKVKVNLKRTASLVVCLNTSEISSASNIDRRSLVIHLPSIGWRDSNSFVSKWRNTINIDLFWGELYSLFKRDPEFQFISDDDIMEQSHIWKQENDATLQIDNCIRKPKKGEIYKILSHVNIKQHIEKISGSPLRHSINGYLKTKGFENVKMRKCPSTGEFKSGYCVLLVEDDTINRINTNDIDSILDKISKEGMQSLTDEEKVILKNNKTNDIF